MADELAVVDDARLPANLDDLAKFALIGRDKLQAVRAEIAAIKKVGLASEVLEQKRAEAQEIAELVTLSEMRMGEMLKEIPKAQGQRNDLQLVAPTCHKSKPKLETLEDMGIAYGAAKQYQQMVEHPELVRQAIAEAREHDDIVSRAAVLKKIKESKKQGENAPGKPHVAYNSGQNEWYTPAGYIDAAREVMGTIDLDPASSDIANKTVGATRYFTIEDDGLAQEWHGNTWMNPPYSSDKIGPFIEKLSKELPNIPNAIVLVNNATDTAWFAKLVENASAVCFPRGRVRFLDPQGNPGAPLQGQAIVYIGKHPGKFRDVFGSFGWTAQL